MGQHVPVPVLLKRDPREGLAADGTLWEKLWELWEKFWLEFWLEKSLEFWL